MRWLAILAMAMLVPVFVVAQDKDKDKDKKDDKKSDVAVSYKDVKSIIESNCVKCHTGDKAKGGLDMTSIANMNKGGKKSKTKALVGGKPDDSVIYKRMKDNSMPPKNVKDQRPTKDEIEKIHAWIKAGAKDDASAEK